jgi:hypothetical protein
MPVTWEFTVKRYQIPEVLSTQPVTVSNVIHQNKYGDIQNVQANISVLMD